MIRRLFPIFILFLSACHASLTAHTVGWDAMPENERRQRIVSDAHELAHRHRFRVNGRSFPKDCSGYIAALLYENGFNVFEGARSMNVRGNGVKLIHDFVNRQGQLSSQTVAPGDLVFFSDTFDKNRDGRVNDPLTHIGIVTGLRKDGTIEFMHFLQGRVRTSVMNLRNPNQRTLGQDSNVINDYLRRRRPSDPASTPTLTSQTFLSFGSLMMRDPALLNLTE